jgi:hypothetical protein
MSLVIYSVKMLDGKTLVKKPRVFMSQSSSCQSWLDMCTMLTLRNSITFSSFFQFGSCRNGTNTMNNNDFSYFYVFYTCEPNIWMKMILLDCHISQCWNQRFLKNSPRLLRIRTSPSRTKDKIWRRKTCSVWSYFSLIQGYSTLSSDVSEKRALEGFQQTKHLPAWTRTWWGFKS